MSTFCTFEPVCPEDYEAFSQEYSEFCALLDEAARITLDENAEAEEESHRAAAHFTRDVESYMTFGFSREEAEDLAATATHHQPASIEVLLATFSH